MSVSTSKKHKLCLYMTFIGCFHFTLCDCAAELQQATEGERSYVRFAPAVRLLFHVLLKLDPASSFLPPHFFILIRDELVQLHEQLKNGIDSNIPNIDSDTPSISVYDCGSGGKAVCSITPSGWRFKFCSLRVCSCVLV